MDKRLIIFAKAAVPGEVKTRLVPALGAERAAMLHAALVERAIDTAQRCKGIDIELCCAPTSAHPFFAECAEDFAITLSEQGEGDLGERMLRALDRGLRAHPQIAILGADCPSVTAKDIAAAITALTTHDVALIPAEDGGYTLIAARRTHPQMFAGIDWGTASVLSAQVEALARCGLSVWQGEVRWDVDTADDLERLRLLKPPLPFVW